MSQISAVQYSKINVLQQNQINNKQSDRQIIVLRKPQHILPQPNEYNKDELLVTNNSKKKINKSTKETKTNSAPVAVARRNARERNRVKQVNNGFATLRQHIPNFIAAAFENSNGRGGNKKLSKVETLKMAVEYIRNLEDILSMDNSGDANDHPYPSPNSSITSPNHQMQNNITYTYQILSPPEDDDDDDLSSNATASPQQFIKIDTSSGAFHVLSNSIYENGENLDPMVVDEHLLAHPPLLDPNLEFNSQDLSYLQKVNSSDCLSPGFYSENSLSPNSLDTNDPNCFIPVFNTPCGDGLGDVKPNINEIPVISLKTENELPNEEKNSMVDMLQWWEHQEPQNRES